MDFCVNFRKGQFLQDKGVYFQQSIYNREMVLISAFVRIFAGALIYIHIITSSLFLSGHYLFERYRQVDSSALKQHQDQSVYWFPL